MPSSPRDMATQPAQSLPSFTQAFSSPSLNRLTSGNNVLPPIHRLASPSDRPRQSPSGRASPQQAADRKHNRRKRLHAESSAGEARDDESGSDEHRSPRAVRIKEEADHDAPTQAPAAARPEPSSKDAREAANASMPPEGRAPPQKRRRVTISGGSNSINTSVSSPTSDNLKSMSPVFMGFTVGRDDPQALEQMRSMLTVKQKQKELIEQRRGSTASIVSTVPPSVNIVNPPEHEESERGVRGPPKAQPQASTQSTSATGKSGGRSPNIPQSQLAADRRRSVAAPAPSQSHPPHPHPPHPVHSSRSSTSSMRHDSPSTLIAAHPQPQQLPPPPLPPPPRAESSTFVHSTTSSVAAHHTLPAPPISFANRRAGRQLGGAKGKPADILINPRASHPENQPAIQSAPPVPRADPTGRFGTMAVPSLPQISGTVHRHAASRVPPTPTRLTVARNPGPSHLGPGAGGAGARSPQNASVPIASSLVPPTPATLQHPSYSSERSAFLAPFEVFYDALADSKQLKNWLAEQLQKSHALAAGLQRQQEQLDELVEAAVERRVGAMREEMYTLHQRVEELEQALRGRGTIPSQSYSPLTGSVGVKGKGKANGMVPAVAPESYTFPPVDPHMRRPDPVRGAPSPGDYDSRSYPGSETASPAPFDVGRRLSVSAVRMAPREPPEPSHTRRTLAVHPTTRERELSGPGYPPPPSGHAGGYGKDRDRDVRAPRVAASLSQSTSRGSVTHLHPSNEDPPERRSTAYQYRAERRGSPASGDERPEGAHPPPRRDPAYRSPPGHARSPRDDS
ncbi:hypothetical protein DAEQUDRAFT_570442 [Daedalea quercina L-15889]|uniref:Uncharacterized protein n=1 Tax=Daedalea quercina L-15889 TaxID=1314783 RepID=A0A165LWY7_9APHY|nr:hypothetical protein DAEQUDRAFT_570442 [Daedalea quercina L-15889]